MLESVTPQFCSIETAKSGDLTLRLIHQQESFYIHSKVHPRAEAEKIIQKIDFEADHIIVLGLGLGYHIEQILLKKKAKARVLIVEPNAEIARCSLEAIDWQTLLERDDTVLFLGTNQNDLANCVEDFFNLILFEKHAVFELISEVRLLKPLFDIASSTIDNEIRTLLYDFKTRLAERSMVARNILKNIPAILKTRPIKFLNNRFADRPGFIVSAGPSLDKNILYLKKVRNRGIVIAVDTALKPLLKRNIHPHFTVTVDPSYYNYLHIMGTEDSIRNYLIAETGIANRVYKDFQKKIFTVSLGKPLFKMIENTIGQVGELTAWGSVISLAVHIAVYLGLNPIVFLGQDFAYSNLRNHCRGTSWEDRWLENTMELDQLQRLELKSIGGIKQTEKTTDIYGNPVLSSDKLILYKNYLVKILADYPKTRFINATEGGIFKEIENQNLLWVLKNFIYQGPEIDLQFIHSIPLIYNSEKTKKLLVFLKTKHTFFRKYQVRILGTLEKLKKVKGKIADETFTVLEEAEKIKFQLYLNKQNGEILEMFSEAPIYELLKKSEKIKSLGVSEKMVLEMVELFISYFSQLSPLLDNVIGSFKRAMEEL